MESQKAVLEYASPSTLKPGNPKWMTIVGWILSLLPSLFMGGLGIVFQLTNPEMVKKTMNDHGYPENTHLWIFIVEIICIVIYLIPQTAVLGAILLTGYLGGAIATHVRAGDPMFEIIFPGIFGVIFWLGLFLRYPQIRKLIPFKC